MMKAFYSVCKNIRRTVIICCLLGIVSIQAMAQQGSVPDLVEFNALKDFYQSTNGASWINKTNWPTDWSTPVDHTVYATWAGLYVAGGDVLAIDMPGNNLTGTLPASLGNLTALQRLEFYSNGLTGSLPASIGNLTSVTWLNMSYNQLTGPLPHSIGNMTALWLLGFQNNYLSGPLPDEIGNLDNLAVLSLGTNQISGRIPATIGNMNTIRAISLYSNHLSGSIPPELAKATTLESVVLSDNQLSGTLPVELKNLSSMHTFTVGTNNLSGTIQPEFFSGMTSLQTLELSFNNFTGPFPSSISTCSLLSSLQCMSNKFTSLPAGLATLPYLYLVNFYTNELKSVPSFASSPSKASMNLQLSRNQLGFGDMEALATSGVANVNFGEQLPIASPGVILFPEGGTLTIPATPAGAHSTIAWEKWTSSGWTNFTSGNEDATNQTYKRTSATIDMEGSYRYKMTNSAVTGIALESQEIIVKSQRRQNIDNWAFQYKYDGRNRMTHKKVPSADWVYMVYDNRDRLVMTQDGNQRAANQWLYTKYDSLNRPVITGIYTHGSSVDQAAMTAIAATVSEGRNANAATHGYTNTPLLSSNFNASGSDVLTVTYYDSYSFIALLDNSGDYSYQSSALAGMYVHSSGGAFPGVKGLTTGTKVKVLGDTRMLPAVSYYDNKYKVIQSASRDLQGGIQRTSNVYDFSGKLLNTKTNYSYQDAGKLTWKYLLKAAPVPGGINQNAPGGWGESGAVSEEQLREGMDGWIEATYKWSPTYTVYGFSETNGGSGSMPDYGFYFNPDLSLGYSISIFEKGIGHALFYYTMLKEGDRLRVERTGGHVRYKVNGEVIYTSSYTYNGQLSGKVAFANMGILPNPTSSFGKGKVEWKDLQAADPQSDRLAQVGHGGWGDSGANSVQTLGAGEAGWIEFDFNDDSPYAFVGFMPVNGTSSPAWAPDYAIYATNTMPNNYRIAVYEKGDFRYFNSAVLVNGDRVRIERTGSGGFVYKVNGVQFYQSNFTSAAAMRIKVSLADGGGRSSVVVRPNCSFCEKTSSVARDFAYDHSGRLLTVTHSIDDGQKIRLVKNEYNELGQLADKKLHSADAVNTTEANRHYRQSVDYQYNIRGWLTKINDSDIRSVANAASDGANEMSDLFGMQLAYDDDAGTTNTRLYNGNISAIKWSTNLGLSEKKMLAYNYEYDTMNRIKGSGMKTSNGISWTATNAFAEYGYGYDLNGNIKKLSRRDTEDRIIDNLTYRYSQLNSATNVSNKLMAVSDASNDKAGFSDGNKVEDDYAYDANGNMVTDKNKNIKSIEYNHLNLPYKVTNFTGDYILYSYDAAGRKLRQQVYEYTNKLQKTTDYRGEMFYENDTLKFINHEEGRVVTKGEDREYQYHLKDHLGNVRMTFTSKDDTETTTATLELQNQAAEVSHYLRYSEAKLVNSVLFDHTHVANGGTPTIIYSNNFSTEFDEFQTAGTMTLGLVSGRLKATGTTAYGAAYRFFPTTEGHRYRLQFAIDFTGSQVNAMSKDFSQEGVITSQVLTNPGSYTLEFTALSNSTAMIFQNLATGHDFYLDDIVVTDLTPGGSGTYSQRLNGSANEKYGLARSLSVMPGDKVKMEVYAKYLDPNTSNWTGALTILAGQLANGTGGVAIDGAAYNYSTGTFPSAMLGHQSNTTNGSPKAYLNWLVFDRNYKYLTGGFKQVTSAAIETGRGEPHEKLAPSGDGTITITEPGYVYIYLSNEQASGQPVEVFFDDFKVEHVKSPVVQTDDYYPFGLAFNSYNRENSIDNRYLYNQGAGEKKFLTERISQLDLNVDLTKYRVYDPVTGRWWQVDPLADEDELVSLTPYNYSVNNPVRYNDPEGDCPSCIWGAVIGAAVDYGTQVAVNLVQGKDLGDALTDVDGGSILMSAGVGALTGGLSALKGASGAVKVADAVADVAKAGDKVADVAKTVDKASDVAGAAVKVEKNVASITGHTKHGLNQSIARDGGRGVNAAAKLDAVKNPVKTVAQAGDKTKYVGKNAQVVLNKDGKVVSAFGKSRGPQTTVQGKGSEALRRAKELGKEYDPKSIR